MQCPLRGITQVVGHTRTNGVERIESGNGVVYFCDCLEMEKYLMIENRYGKWTFYQQTSKNPLTVFKETNVK